MDAAPHGGDQRVTLSERRSTATAARSPRAARPRPLASDDDRSEPPKDRSRLRLRRLEWPGCARRAVEVRPGQIVISAGTHWTECPDRFHSVDRRLASVRRVGIMPGPGREESPRGKLTDTRRRKASLHRGPGTLKQVSSILMFGPLLPSGDSITHLAGGWRWMARS